MNTLLLFPASLLLLQPAQIDAKQALDQIRLAVGSGGEPRVRGLFARPGDADYLLKMAAGGGGLSKLGVKVIPTPPGWEDQGSYWAVFHTFQEIEQDHDTVYPILKTESGWKLGKEIPEWAPSSHKIQHASLDVALVPSEKRARVSAILTLQPTNAPAAPLFRLNDIYSVSRAFAGDKRLNVVEATDQAVPQPKNGDILRAGGLLIYWSKEPLKTLRVDYGGIVDKPNHDKITDQVAYLTAYWVPVLGRLPFTTTTRIKGPKEWIIRSEGNMMSQEQAGFSPLPAKEGEQIASFKCDIPISYPKVTAGAYKLAAQGTDKGRTFRAYHINVNKARAEADVQRMIDFCRFFDDKLGPFPFQSYEVFDGIGYYGIESYSYTILAPEITNWATSHEMGHTYFGGLAPSAYTRDTWNEGVTQYVDSVLFLKNADQSLQNGFRTAGLNVPLSKMDIAWDYGSATYFRGAYVMNMLAAEIGLDAIYAGLRALVTERRGKDTLWADLRAPFEKASGKQLGWFWSQWINSASFPTVSVLKATLARGGTRSVASLSTEAMFGGTRSVASLSTEAMFGGTRSVASLSTEAMFGGTRSVASESADRTEPVPPQSAFTTHVIVRQTGTADPYRLRFAIKLSRGSQVKETVVTMNSPEGGFTIPSSFAPTEATIELFPHMLGKAGQPVPVKG